MTNIEEVDFIIDLEKDFSDDPYGRDEKDGEFNGKAFREQHILPALSNHQTILVELGNVIAGSSFLDEAFAGLIRYCGFTLDQVKSRVLVHHDLQSYSIEINDYLERAAKEK